MPKINYFGIIFWIHIFIILFIYLSPFFLSWEFVFFIAVFLNLQEIIIGGCFITDIQFGRNDISFHYRYLNKVGIKIERELLPYLDYLGPWILVILAGLIQARGFVPLIF